VPIARIGVTTGVPLPSSNSGPAEVKLKTAENDNHRVTVLATLALLDPDQQAQTIDIGDLQGDHFGRAQSGTVGNAQRRLVLETRPRRRFDQSSNLIRLSTRGSRRG
jgi:hypothetical protein